MNLDGPERLGAFDFSVVNIQKPTARCLFGEMKNRGGAIGLGALLLVTPALADEPKLEPNARLYFEFPDLPDTLASKFTGKRRTARLTAQLPQNYQRDGKYPLFVFLNGGDGGYADAPVGREIIGTRDFVCVNLPLFKRTFGLLISMEDYEVVSRAYHTMLQRLLDAVPNITSERSAFGGASNGAHTTAVLLSGQDGFILRHFQAFYFWEGGADILAGHVLEKASSKRFRFLLLRGDQPEKDEPLFRDAYTHLCLALEMIAKQNSLDFTSIIVRGYGHEFPPKYFPVIDHWVRGDRLPEVESK
jgi:hypothetical protein